MSKLLQYLFHPTYVLFWLDLKRFITLKDESYLKIMFFKTMHTKLNLEEPKTFNEKLQWLKLYDRQERYAKLVDKYEVKQYVEEKIGKGYTIPTLGIYDEFKKIDFESLPHRFVMKCTHDSGGVIVCKNKDEFDKRKAQIFIEKSLSRNFYYYGREWPYKNVKPRIIIEEYMENGDSELIDYKFMCFNGEPKMVFTCTERFGEGLKVTFFDLNWNKLPFKRHYPPSDKVIEKPKCFDKMLEISKILSKDIPFVRVDFYEIKGHPYIGELTFYPGCGLEEFTPKEWDNTLGSWITLPKKETNYEK